MGGLMRFLATADNHLGKGMDLGLTPGERLAEQEQVWRATLELARDRQVTAVLHGGDLFDGRRPSPEIMLAAERPLVEHQAAGGCRVLVAAGNHDVPSQDGPCGLDVLAEAGLIRLARDPKVWRIGPVEVCALPWTPLSRLIATDGGETPRDGLAALAADLLLETARGMSNTGVPQILLGHWSVSQTSLPNGLDVGSLGGVVLPMDDLQALGFDALVFGHIHSPQEHGWFLYTGSPMPLDFGEGNDLHGCWIIDTDSIGSPEFVPLQSRPFITIKATDDWGALEAEGKLAGAFVKVRGSLTEDQMRRWDQQLTRDSLEMAGAYRVFIDLIVERAHRERGHVLDDAGTRIDQLAAYLDAIGVNGDIAPAMLERAAGYLS